MRFDTHILELKRKCSTNAKEQKHERLLKYKQHSPSACLFDTYVAFKHLPGFPSHHHAKKRGAIKASVEMPTVGPSCITGIAFGRSGSDPHEATDCDVVTPVIAGPAW